MARSYYSKSLVDFFSQDETSILGTLAEKNNFTLEQTQRDSWLTQIRILKDSLSELESGHILFEYTIPRMGKRADAILLINGLVLVIEFKVGESHFQKQYVDQVLDYCLDLKNFHLESHDKIIIPILVSTHSPVGFDYNLEHFPDNVYKPLKCGANGLRETIKNIVNTFNEVSFEPIAWENSQYKPTPTIIEAAQALYRGHSVKEISRSDAGSLNLTKTTEAINQIIEDTKKSSQKSIIFLTGVPGAGKTLAGLNIANSRHNATKGEHAILLSGNGPLVKVLQEALARNKVELKAQTGIKIRKNDALRETKNFIQVIHHFRDHYLKDLNPPAERIAIFDEAQRAWNMEETSSFMKRKKSMPNFSMSEPAFLMSLMDRHKDWGVIVCLIGGGQEINKGEAGMIEWLRALKTRFTDWKVYTSDRLNSDEYLGDQKISEFINVDNLNIEQNLHLTTSVRSFRSEKVSELVKFILDLNIKSAKEIYDEIKGQYSIVITRDLESAKRWLNQQARGSERFGLLASSSAHRLKPFGINVKAKIDETHYFLNGKEDIRSSYFLEDVATEFQVQGLELDWTCVCWDGDLRFSSTGWTYKDFSGTSWHSINSSVRAKYLKNAYRVLLTRARQGMVIFIPEGDNHDHTRLNKFYDGTFNYLTSIGFDVI